MTRITINHQEVRAIATDIQQQMKLAQDALAKLEGNVKLLLSVWEGKSQKSFQDAYFLCKTDLEQGLFMLERVNQALLQTIDLIEQAEQQVKPDRQ